MLIRHYELLNFLFRKRPLRSPLKKLAVSSAKLAVQNINVLFY